MRYYTGMNMMSKAYGVYTGRCVGGMTGTVSGTFLCGFSSVTSTSCHVESYKRGNTWDSMGATCTWTAPAFSGETRVIWLPDLGYGSDSVTLHNVVDIGGEWNFYTYAWFNNCLYGQKDGYVPMSVFCAVSGGDGPQAGTRLPTKIPTHLPTWSPLPPVSVTPYEYAFFSNLVYTAPDMGQAKSSGNPDGNWGYDLSPLTGDFAGWSVLDISTWDTTAYYGIAFQKGSSIVIAHKGTQLSHLNDLETDYDLAVQAVSSTSHGFVDNYFSSASAFVAGIKVLVPEGTITFTGHSLGGALAEVCAASLGSSAVVFDSPGAAGYLKNNHLNPGDVVAYQASPNLIDTLDTSLITTVYRIYPPYDVDNQLVTLTEQLINAAQASGQVLLNKLAAFFPSVGFRALYAVYTYDQHSKERILHQFDSITGLPFVSSEQTSCWQVFSNDHGYKGFYLRSDLNAYYWLHYDPVLSSSVQKYVSEQSADLTPISCNFIITGSDNHDDLLWGAGFYDDTLDGKSGNDQYWAFSGTDTINDISGQDTYHFFTTNMQGLTTINDGDGQGILTLDNFQRCNLVHGIVPVKNSASLFAFYPYHSNTGCSADASFSSQLYGLLNRRLDADILLLQLVGSSLQITLNSKTPTDSGNAGTIIVSHFSQGHLGITLSNTGTTTKTQVLDATPSYYVGGEEEDVLQCKTGEDSYLFGLSGNDRFISFDNNTHSCVMVGGLYGTKTYVLQPSGGSAASASTLTIKGYKGDDLLDFSAFNFNQAAVEQDPVSGQVTLNLPNGATILLPTVYHNISYTFDGQSNVTFSPAIIEYNNNVSSTLSSSSTTTQTNTLTSTANLKTSCLSYNESDIAHWISAHCTNIPKTAKADMIAIHHYQQCQLLINESMRYCATPLNCEVDTHCNASLAGPHSSPFPGLALSDATSEAPYAAGVSLLCASFTAMMLFD